MPFQTYFCLCETVNFLSRSGLLPLVYSNSWQFIVAPAMLVVHELPYISCLHYVTYVQGTTAPDHFISQKNTFTLRASYETEHLQHGVDKYDQSRTNCKKSCPLFI